jgi:hypothetical protein
MSPMLPSDAAIHPKQAEMVIAEGHIPPVATHAIRAWLSGLYFATIFAVGVALTVAWTGFIVVLLWRAIEQLM